jgi:hypothetical protein
VVLLGATRFLWGPGGPPEAFKQILPDALSAEGWFRFHGRYANGDPIAAKV